MTNDNEDRTKAGELLPCPLCNGDALLSILDKHGRVFCNRCELSTKEMFDPLDNHRLFQQLLSLWNTRPQPQGETITLSVDDFYKHLTTAYNTGWASEIDGPKRHERIEKIIQQARSGKV